MSFNKMVAGESPVMVSLLINFLVSAPPTTLYYVP